MIKIIIKCKTGRSCKRNLWNSAKTHFLSQYSWNTNVAQRSGKIACLTGMKSHEIHRIRSKLSTLRLSLMSIDTLRDTRLNRLWILILSCIMYIYIPTYCVSYAVNKKITYNIRLNSPSTHLRSNSYS